jgi:hypothetical protein
MLKDTIELLVKINHVIIGSKKYLESEKFIKLDSRYVFIDPKQMEIYVLCIPVMNCNFWEEYFNFTVNDLLTLPEKNNSTENIIKYISNYLKSDGFTIENLNEILIDILKNVLGQRVITNNLYNDAQLTDEKEEEFSIEQYRDTNKLKEKEACIPTVLLGVFLQSVIVAGGVFLYSDFFGFEYFSYSNNSVLISVLLSIIVWFFIIRRVILLNKDYNLVILTKFEVINIPEHGNFDKIIHEEKYNKRFLGTILPDFNYSTSAFLEASIDGTYKRIFITKPVFILGTDAEASDYVIETPNNIRGNGHIEILHMNGEYILVDCNSNYGTYLNSNRVENNIRTRIENEDVLDIASGKYIFKK